MMRLSIIHYFPISHFPPAMNLIDVLKNKFTIDVYTGRPLVGTLDYQQEGVDVMCVIANKESDPSFIRLIKYLYFVVYTLLHYLIRRPEFIMYYESISALPAYIYKKYINQEARLIVHYHEYVSDDEYKKNGLRIANFNHKLEKKYIYSNCVWISQTNYKRNEFFLKDNPNINTNNLFVLPNYPPASWLCKKKEHKNNICQCVYIGSLSLEDTFVREFTDWVIKQNGTVLFDIYCFNFDVTAKEYIKNLNTPYIKFYDAGVRYYEIPKILSSYDVGVLLYKAHNLNFKWNETNKLYEYLICGLDVWYPRQMLFLHEMDKSQYAPNIVELDFNNLPKNINRCNEHIDNSNYSQFADSVYNNFYDRITK